MIMVIMIQWWSKMVRVIQDFIENNLDLIDSEDWETLLDKMAQDIPNGLIQQCFDYFEEAGIDIDELCMIRTARLIEKIESILKSKKPNRYKPNEIIAEIALNERYGNDLYDLIYFIYYNQDFWPDNLEFIDMGFEKDPEHGYYIIKVN